MNIGNAFAASLKIVSDGKHAKHGAPGEKGGFGDALMAVKGLPQKHAKTAATHDTHAARPSSATPEKLAGPKTSARFGDIFATGATNAKLLEKALSPDKPAITTKAQDSAPKSPGISQGDGEGVNAEVTGDDALGKLSWENAPKILPAKTDLQEDGVKIRTDAEVLRVEPVAADIVTAPTKPDDSISEIDEDTGVDENPNPRGASVSAGATSGKSTSVLVNPAPDKLEPDPDKTGLHERGPKARTDAEILLIETVTADILATPAKRDNSTSEKDDDTGIDEKPDASDALEPVDAISVDVTIPTQEVKNDFGIPGPRIVTETDRVQYQPKGNDTALRLTDAGPPKTLAGDESGIRGTIQHPEQSKAGKADEIRMVTEPTSAATRADSVVAPLSEGLPAGENIVVNAPDRGMLAKLNSTEATAVPHANRVVLPGAKPTLTPDASMQKHWLSSAPSAATQPPATRQSSTILPPAPPHRSERSSVVNPVKEIAAAATDGSRQNALQSSTPASDVGRPLTTPESTPVGGKQETDIAAPIATLTETTTRSPGPSTAAVAPAIKAAPSGPEIQRQPVQSRAIPLSEPAPAKTSARARQQEKAIPEDVLAPRPGGQSVDAPKHPNFRATTVDGQPARHLDPQTPMRPVVDATQKPVQAAQAPVENDADKASDLPRQFSDKAAVESAPQRVTVVSSRSIAAPAPAVAAHPNMSVTATRLVETMAAEPDMPSAAADSLDRADAPTSGRFSPVKSLQLQLHPHHLGTVTVKLTTTGQQMSVELQVDNNEAHHRLSNDSDSIVKALKGLGFDIDRVTIHQSHVTGTHNPQGAESASRDTGSAMSQNNGGDTESRSSRQNPQGKNQHEAQGDSGHQTARASRSSGGVYI